MSKVEAPKIEPNATAEPVRPRGKYIDFAPRRKKKVAPKVSVVVEEDTPVEELTVADVLDNEPVTEETTVVVTPEEDEFAGLDEAFVGSDGEETGPLAEFNELDEETQEDFISDSNPEEYVEEVLSQVSETRTETTVRRSPFLKNYHVEKRPLSSRIPVRENVPSVEALEPTPRKEYREEEFIKKADSAPDNAEVPVETEEEKTGSRLGMILTVLITILLGAGVGVFVYLAFFK